MKEKMNDDSGFTLIELVVTIVLIGIIASIAFGLMITNAFNINQINEEVYKDSRDHQVFMNDAESIIKNSIAFQNISSRDTGVSGSISNTSAYMSEQMNGQCETLYNIYDEDIVLRLQGEDAIYFNNNIDNSNKEEYAKRLIESDTPEVTVSQRYPIQVLDWHFSHDINSQYYTPTQTIQSSSIQVAHFSPKVDNLSQTSHCWGEED